MQTLLRLASSRRPFCAVGGQCQGSTALTSTRHFHARLFLLATKPQVAPAESDDNKSKYANNNETKKSSKGANSPRAKALKGPRSHLVRDHLRLQKLEKKHAMRLQTAPSPQHDAPATPSTEPIVREIPPNVKAFAALNLMRPLLRAIDTLGWTKPTHVQHQTIPVAIKGRNIVASAQTGTGKTAAYALPTLHRLHIHLQKERKQIAKGEVEPRVAAPLALIVCVSRELAEQVMEQTYALAKELPNVRIMGLYGALNSRSAQEKELLKGVDILVSTPGRLITMIKNKKVISAVSKKRSPIGSYDVDNDDEDLDLEDEESEENAALLDEFFDSVDKSGKYNAALKGKGKGGAAEIDEGWDDDEIDEEWEEAMQKMKGKGKDKAKDKKAEKIGKLRTEVLSEGNKTVDSDEGIIDLSRVKVFVLDEVDRMLDMGHMPDIRTIFLNLPKPHNPASQSQSKDEGMQVMMVTATLMPKVMNLVARFAPRNEKIDLNWDLKVADTVKQVLYNVHQKRKHALLSYLLRRRGSFRDKKVLVFARTRQRVVNLTERLKGEDFRAACIHKEQSVETRQKIVDAFKAGEIDVLVSTDLMARGIDLPNLEVVINYDVPHLAEEYIHRVGRTGRAGKEGRAYTFVAKEPVVFKLGKQIVSLDESEYLQKIEKLLGRKILVSKVPGPWIDEAMVEEGGEVRQKVRAEDIAARIKELRDKHQRIADHAGKRKRVRASTDAEKESYRIIKMSEHTLRDFPESRYEDVLERLERLRAQRNGVVIPNNFDEFVKDAEQKKEKLRQEKRESILKRQTLGKRFAQPLRPTHRPTGVKMERKEAEVKEREPNDKPNSKLAASVQSIINARKPTESRREAPFKSRPDRINSEPRRSSWENERVSIAAESKNYSAARRRPRSQSL